LPKDVKIRIYTVSGALIRTIKKSDNLTSSDWDLKNDHGIPVASGLYIIHVDAEGVGEKILKWFGVLRPIDLDTF
jgi:flagellar hook assembly protein FlgD